MGNRSLKEVENLAHRILTTYFCDSDLEFMISTFAADIDVYKRQTQYTIETYGAGSGVAGLSASIFVIGTLAARLFAGSRLEQIGHKMCIRDRKGAVKSSSIKITFVSLRDSNFSTSLYKEYCSGKKAEVVIYILDYI